MNVGPSPTRPAAPGETAPLVLPRRGFVLLILLTLFWGFNWPMIKVGLEGLPVLTFRAVCLAGGAILMLGIARALGHSLRVPRRQWPALALVALLNMTLWHVLTGYGVDLSEAGRAAIIAYTMPVWTVPLSRVVLGERVTWRRALSLVLGTAGLAVLVITDFRAREGVPLGALLMLGGAMVWAAGTVVQKKVNWSVPSEVLIGWQFVVGGIPIFIAAAISDASHLTMPSLWPLLAVLYNVFIPFVFCYYAYYEVLRLFPVGIATIGVLAIPAVGLLSGALVLGEELGWAELSALGLVIGALAVPLLTRPRGVVVGGPRD